ncbi:MAG: tRNA preQ1(34) S-adenosylmethionine ribosyltransferase-isomerase QueA [Thermodesulfobacteriota bacterium]
MSSPDESAFLLSSYDYPLDPELIAQEPDPSRSGSRLLRLDRSTGAFAHLHFSELPRLLRQGDVLVVNDTRVIRARLMGRKKTGGRVEVFLLDYPGGRARMARGQPFACECLVSSRRPLPPDAEILFEEGYTAIAGERSGNARFVTFSCADPDRMLSDIGRVPLPPYIRRDEAEPNARDAETYQTVYAQAPGAVAAPTAGLHFTPEILNALRNKGVTLVPLTLHVGIGTFLPVRVPDVRDHRMHSEAFTVPEETARAVNLAKAQGRRVIACGTTSVRTLEFSASEHGSVTPGTGSCDLFITPGYRFKTVDAMITNFHLPRSTLLLLVSAFAGRENILAAYAEAARLGYRFFSYGDAMFIGDA